MSVFIVAEAGVNHNGSVALAKKLIDVASNSGADAVKFQTFKAEKLVLKNIQKAEYQKKSTNPAESQFDMIKKLELDENSHQELIIYCKEKNIMFLSSPFDEDSIDLLARLELKIFKIPSGEITNLPYLRVIGSLDKQLLLSTGMSTLKEIEAALSILINAGTAKDKITVMHANTMYPTPMEDVNLNAMITIKREFDVAVGFSDHTLGIEADIAAVAIGASVIEKHFTIDRNMEGPDHKASIEPDELKAMVTAIRNIEKALGSYKKKPSPSESINLDPVRKSIVAKDIIRKGEEFSINNITTRRPGTGISPMEWDKIIGTLASKNYKIGDLI